jgi:NAD(P)-dependent dehydrogenase (short-subunit alcohol dehydrogenase family)
MARIFITGSADGLGQLAAQELIAQGHNVVLHARNEQRAADALGKVPGAEAILTAELGSIEQTIELAAKVNAMGSFDAVIHNAGVFGIARKEMFTINTLAPYILTSLIAKPKRLIYLSSDMHLQGRAKLDSFKTDISHISYSDTKLHVLMLSKAVASHWPWVYANAVNPGWVPTKMGGRSAPDSLEGGYATQVWLAAGEDERTKVRGRYFFHQKEVHSNPEADDPALNERLLGLCAELTGVAFPE